MNSRMGFMATEKPCLKRQTNNNKKAMETSGRPSLAGKSMFSGTRFWEICHVLCFALHWRKQSRNMPVYQHPRKKKISNHMSTCSFSTLIASTLGCLWIFQGSSNETTMSPDQGLSICQGFTTSQQTQNMVEATGVRHQRTPSI